MPFRQMFQRGFIGCAAIGAIAAVTLGIGWHQGPAEARLVAFEPMANFGASETCTPHVIWPSGAAAAGAAIASRTSRTNVATRRKWRKVCLLMHWLLMRGWNIRFMDAVPTAPNRTLRAGSCS